MSDSKRGGYREGAGRKPNETQRKRKRKSYFVSAEEDAILKLFHAKLKSGEITEKDLRRLGLVAEDEN